MTSNLFTLVFSMAITTTAATHARPFQELPVLPGYWNKLLWEVSNMTGKIDRDPILEQLVTQVFHDHITPTLQGSKKVMGKIMDPLWMWPVEERIEDDVFEADFSACDIHVHNFRSIQLLDTKVYRYPQFNPNTIALRILFRFPILWLTGYYKLLGSVAFGFIPVKNRQGDFNIDIKDISAVIMASMKTNPQNSSDPVVIEDFHVQVNWKNVDVKFHRIAGRLSTIANLVINQLGLGRVVIAKEKKKFLSEARDYFKALFQCYLNKPASGVDICMRAFWEARGWEWPWRYPTCNKVVG